MLQVITGKFFDTSDHYETPNKVILYSNFYYDEPINTIIGTLERVRGNEPAYGNLININTYVFSYTNRMPKVKNGQPGIAVALGDDEIVEEFCYLCSHGLDALFSKERDLIEQHCFQKEDPSVRNQYHVSTYFDTRVEGDTVKVNDFIDYIREFIGQPNVMYKHVMECYKNMYHSLLNLHVNLDLAFSQLVYCLESLPQNYDNFAPEWSDYPLDTRLKLEKEFDQIDDVHLVESIKKILIEATHLKSTQRFIEFTISHVETNFFRSEAVTIKNPIKRMELKQSLSNTYDRRSKYVHMLKSFNHESKMLDNNREVFEVENSPYLTYSGLMRLTKHVIQNFVLRADYLETEVIDWDKDLPGMVNVYFDPQLWFYNVEGFSEKSTIKKMVGFLFILASFLESGKKMSDDPTPLLELYEEKMHDFKDPDKLNILVIYMISHKLITSINKDKYHKIIKKYNHLFNKCSIQGLIISIFNYTIFSWTASEAEKTYRTYKKKRLNRVDKSPYSIMNIPFSIEIGIFINIANQYLTENNVQKFKELLEEAIDELSGDPDKQDILTFHLQNNTEVDINFLYFKGRDQVDSIEYYI